MSERTNGLHAAVQAKRRSAPDGGWELISGHPQSRLRPAVRGYEGYVESMPHPLRRRELPSTSIVLIVNFGPPYRLLDPADPENRARSVEQKGGFVAGLDDSFAVTESTGAAHCLQINLAPLAAHRLFGHPMSDLTRRVVALDELLGADANLLTERLFAMPSWEERFARLDATIARLLAAAPPPSPEIVWAWRQLDRSSGRVSVASLTTELGWSPKRLIARFREQIGLPPKLVARLLRFQRANACLASGEAPDWAEFARDHGFFDQSHLIHEFQHFGGDTPQGLTRRRMAENGGYSSG